MKRTIAVITCKPDPDYVRALTIRAAVETMPDWELITVKNSQHGVLRYPEIAWKLLKLRVTKNPDVYLLTFRGYEILPWLLVVAVGKKIIFDEFINLTEWVVHEHKKLKPGSLPAKALNTIYSWWLHGCNTILTDTDSHADLSASLSGVPRSRYVGLPVGTDESVFFPDPTAQKAVPYNVFFYGNILPLHGLDVMLAAADRLKDRKDIAFTFIGGKPKHQAQIEAAIANGANITYVKRVPFDTLPSYIHTASLCLGGPFGNTYQSQYVVTGKTYQFLACGVPTVVGKSTASEGFVDRRNCLVVPQGDPDALMHAILWAFDHPAECQAIGAEGRALYEAEFSSAVIARRLGEILSNLGF